jgi:hypothetical protein
VADQDPSREETLTATAREFWDELCMFVSTLPVGLRPGSAELLFRRFYLRETTGEIEEAMGMPEGTQASRFSRIRVCALEAGETVVGEAFT